MGFLGGQYIIINSQIPLASNPEKTHKKGYSIFSNDENQNEFQLVFREIQGWGSFQFFSKGLKGEPTVFWSFGKIFEGRRLLGRGKSLVMALIRESYRPGLCKFSKE